MRKLFVRSLIVAAHVRVRADHDRQRAVRSRRWGSSRRSSTSTCPSWMAMFTADRRLRRRERDLPVQGHRAARTGSRSPAAEIAVVFGLIGLVTGPLWGRKAWGVWWQWDARLTMALLLELIFVGYLLVRKYGGPGLGEARGGDGASSARRRRRSSTSRWTSGARCTRRRASCRCSARRRRAWRRPFWFCVVAFILLFVAAAGRCACGSSDRRAALDELYLAQED